MATNIGILRRPLAPTGIWSWLTTIDHKRIGILYGVTASFFFLLGGIEALLMRAQLAQADSTIVGAETFNALFTMHGTTMVFMVIMPAGAAAFNYVIPLMIGARDVAFPRLNAFSYWLYLFGALLMNFSFFMNAFPDVGWFGYAPLTSNEYTLSSSTNYWVLGLLVMGTGTLAAGFNFVVTILNLRAPGMPLLRMPVFVWMTLITAFLIIFAFPVFTIALIALMLDRFFEFNFFNTAGAGSDPLMWQHLFWVFGHPEVYILILPAMGIVSDVLPTFARKPLFGYTTVVAAGAVIAFMGFGVWAHHMFTVGMGPWATGAFALTTMAIAVPTGVKVFNWIATLWGGSLEFKTPMLFSIGFIMMFLIGGLSGLMHAAVPVDAQHQDSYFVVAHFHYTLFGGSMYGLLAGLYYWFPKVTGKMMNERLGKLHFWVMSIGFNLTFISQFIVGATGMPRRIYTYSEAQGWETLNLMASFGAVILGISFLVLLVNLIRSVRNGEEAGANPWNAATLEWAISSPPHHYNFGVVPTVQSLYPLWDEEANAIAPPEEPAHEEPVMPSPSYWPLVLAFAVTMAAGGLIIWEGHNIAGLTVMSSMGLLGLRAIYGWSFEPAIVEEGVPAHH